MPEMDSIFNFKEDKERLCKFINKAIAELTIENQGLIDDMDLSDFDNANIAKDFLEKLELVSRYNEFRKVYGCKKENE